MRLAGQPGSAMRFGIFYEHQNPRPWVEERSEHRLLRDALEQVELADRVGIDYVWEVEHHFLEEYSHSSAPEVFLAAASQRTKDIRLGHGIVQIPPGFNHPARVAERIATLDLVSGGRVEFGTGESSSQAEHGFAREIINADEGALGVKILQQGLGSLRGAIGTPEQVVDLVQRYIEAGVDQVIFVQQAGPNKHEHICESLKL